MKLPTLLIIKYYYSRHQGLQLCLSGVPNTYRVYQQCCPGGNRPETPRPDFLAKSLVILAIYLKFKLLTNKFKLGFRIYGWNYQ